MEERERKLISGYDDLAGIYAEKFFHELEHKPIDRELLARLADYVDGIGPICDMGCGPGQIARYLHDLGATVLGVDISAEMVAVARRLNPHIEFWEGNMLSLEFDDESWGGIAAFYSIIHIPHAKIVEALRELKRVLKPGGTLLLSFHIGEEIMNILELWGKEVDMYFIFFPVEQMLGYVRAAGFEHLDTVERPPYRDVEYQSHRAYIFAGKPEGENIE
jgi:ubiquinone/menaquinone biosynthesis C-methylase UbiE